MRIIKINILEKQFDQLSRKIKRNFKKFYKYIDRLIVPVYLFPFKLVTYSIYYLVKFIISFFASLIKIIIDLIIFPFRSLKNFLQAIFIIILVSYMVASVFVISDYITKQYGWWDKFFCSVGVEEKMKKSVVRIVGTYSEGSGFFIKPNQVVTNFHVIADEASPKIIFADNQFITPIEMIGDPSSDIAVLTTKENYPDLVLPLPPGYEFSSERQILEDEPLIAAGYPLGTDLLGQATLLRGRFKSYRELKDPYGKYIQTDINLVEGMSGGPLVDQCGKVVGINTIGLSGLSLFIEADSAKTHIIFSNDLDITKIDVDPTISPVEAVRAFYTYLKARRMQDGFDLLSQEYLKKTDFIEWTNRFRGTLDANIILVEPFEETVDTVFVKFSTKMWRGIDIEIHHYEGTWQTVEEDGVYKMNRSKIEEVEDPDWEWFYE